MEATEYLQKNVNPVLLRGLTQLCKEKPADALVSDLVMMLIYPMVIGVAGSLVD